MRLCHPHKVSCKCAKRRVFQDLSAVRARVSNLSVRVSLGVNESSNQWCLGTPQAVIRDNMLLEAWSLGRVSLNSLVKNAFLDLRLKKFRV